MLVMVVWGATPVATRIATEELEPLMVAVLRTVLAGVVAVPLLAGGAMRPPARGRTRLLLAISAVAGFVFFPVVYTLGQERTSAMHGVGILAGLPVFTGLYAAAVARTLPGRWWVIGCALALVGEGVIIAIRTAGGETEAIARRRSPRARRGARRVVRLRRGRAPRPARVVERRDHVLGRRARLDRPRSRSASECSSPTVCRVPISESWGAVVFLALATSILGYVGWYWALAHGGIARIAPLQFLQPVSGLLLAALVLDERLSWPLGVGAAAVIGGVALARASEVSA